VSIDDLKLDVDERETMDNAKCDSPNKTKENDPWINRSEGMKCSTCMWFVLKNAGLTLNQTIGRCRRHAPTMNGYPVVFLNDWCGDHKLNERKT